MEKLLQKIDEIDNMIQTLESYLEKWNEMKVPNFKYSINKFENLITALKIHRNMLESHLDYYKK